MANLGALANVPFLGGYLAQEEYNRNAGAEQQQATARNLAMLAQMRQLKQDADVRAVMANAPDAQTAIPSLLKLGPSGVAAANSLAGLAEHQAKLAKSQREAQFYSPENQAKFMDTIVTPPDNPVGELGPNPPTETKQLNADKMLAAAASQNLISPEAWANHKAQRENQRMQIVAQFQAKEQQLEQAKQNAQMMHEFRMANLSNAQDRAAETARHNKVMEGLQAQIASSNAELKRIGLDLQIQRITNAQTQQTQKQTTQLGAALEKAGLPESDAVLGAVEKAMQDTPKVAEYISGPKSMLPDIAIPKDVAIARQAFQKLFNITLKNRSGAAVTIPEFERLKAEFGTGTFKTSEQLKGAITQARNIIQKHYASIASGFGPNALNEYNDNARAIGANVVVSPNLVDFGDLK